MLVSGSRYPASRHSVASLVIRTIFYHRAVLWEGRALSQGRWGLLLRHSALPEAVMGLPERDLTPRPPVPATRARPTHLDLWKKLKEDTSYAALSSTALGSPL